MVRLLFLVSLFMAVTFNFLLAPVWPGVLWSFIIILPLAYIGFADMLQKKRAVRRNFPILGNFRYIMEIIRPEINQYFVESNSSGVPFSRMERSVVYQRAKNVRDSVPFGTQLDVYGTGYEWVNHSLTPRIVKSVDMRVDVGGSDCTQPYSASLLNIGAMSYGALSKNAITSLNEGAKIGNFAHNTGEGGISEYHLKGGDLIWQVGTGYFGCRTKDGNFDPKQFEDRANLPNVKMIELKLSQGAKPGKGGVLPGVKVSEEIARARGVEVGKTIISPPAHNTFDTPVALCEFISLLRKLSKGKPIGIKLCLGKRREFIAICKAMLKTGIMPDFISVDGSEGGTGAAPLEFVNYVGNPLTESLIFIHNSLVGFGLRENIRLIASGKVTTGFGMIHRLAIGADLVYSARGMMMALGCIQALKCNTNHCPVGVATQDPSLSSGLVVSDKRIRVANYHKNTVHSLAQIIGAMGLNHPHQLKPYHIFRRIDNSNIKNYERIYDFLEKDQLLGDSYPHIYDRPMHASSAETFASLLDPI